MQDYNDVLTILRKDLDDKSAEVREAMNDVANLKTLISQIVALNPPVQIAPESSPDPTI